MPAADASRGYRVQLSRDDVARLARLRDIPIDESDLDEVRYRLNALSEALATLDDPELDGVDPLPVLLPEGETYSG